MTEAVWHTHWQEVLASLKPLMTIPHPRMPDSEHLDRLESRLNFRLPYSYRAFIRVFGPVLLANDRFEIYSPAYPGKGKVTDIFNKNTRWHEFQIRNVFDPLKLDVIARAITIGSDRLGRTCFFWDRESVTNPDTHEYTILCEPEDPEADFIMITDSFGAFIEEYCLGGKFNKLIGRAKTAKRSSTYTPMAGIEIPR